MAIIMNPGSRLGPYEIVGPIGAGGMGMVYRARDARLGRDVAVKTLPEAVAHDRERRARFEREARLLAALNHPHVGAIYGVEIADGAPALILELVEGLTLQDVIRENAVRGRTLPLTEAAAIARQIADALEAAHEKGIVHRDLKPANVKITPEGTVKVLDFGLGKMMSSVAENPSDPSHDPTRTAGGTRSGTVLGTAAYMSPEQARGVVVDRRTDIWAFGCVLFEMLTGLRSFGGATFSDTLVQVMTLDPDWSRLPHETPAAVRRLLRRCLQKEARLRLHDIADARLELSEGLEESAAPPVAARDDRPARDIHLHRLTDSGGLVGSPALSPDGKMVTFVAVVGRRRQIWIRLLAGGAPLQITRDDADHEEPRWMPDSSGLVYYSGKDEGATGHLYQVSALGGLPRRIVAAIGGGDVSHDGRRLAFFEPGPQGPALVTAALDGSEPRILVSFPSDSWCDHPRWSPDDSRIAFYRAGVFFDTRIEAVEAGGGEPQTVVRAAWMRGHCWLPDGSGFVYSSSKGSSMPYPPTNNLRTVRRDGSRDRQLSFGDQSFFEPDVDGSGRLVASRVRNLSDVWRFPIAGAPADNVSHAVRITRQSGQIQVPSLSPDGCEMVYLSDNGGHSNVWVAAVDGSFAQQITFERDPEISVGLPIWAPVGDSILFLKVGDGRFTLCLVNRDGSGFRTLLKDAFAPCWSHDGKWVYFARSAQSLERVEVATGAVVTVRSRGAISPTISREGGALFFIRPPEQFGPNGESEVCRVAPEDGPEEVLARIANARVPLVPRLLASVQVSPDGRHLATALIDGTTVNIWLIPTDGGPMRAITDFGDRSVSIVRGISWSPDSQWVYAAVADTDADIVLFEGALG